MHDGNITELLQSLTNESAERTGQELNPSVVSRNKRLKDPRGRTHKMAARSANMDENKTMEDILDPHSPLLVGREQPHWNWGSACLGKMLGKARK